MSKVLLCGEGPHDVGRRGWSVRSAVEESTDGWLQPLVRRLRTSEGADIAIYLKQLVALPRRPGQPRPLTGLGLKAQMAKFRAATEGCSAVVVATDTDSADAREHRAKVDAIDAGFVAYPAELLGVPCVSMGTSEAWLLGDGEAWTTLGATNLDLLPRRPEETWGRPHEPTSNHPKCVFARVCDDNDIPDNTHTRATLAAICRLDHLRKACPVSYAAFEERARDI